LVVGAHDVAAAILKELGPIDPLTLQKLLFYAQAWHLAWYEQPLFREHIEAWQDGPTVRSVWDTYKDHEWHPIMSARGGDPTALLDRDREALAAVLTAYRSFSGRQLRDRTHNEKPWVDAWNERQYAAWGNREITQDAMREFFSGEAEFPGVEGANDDIDPETAEAFMHADPRAIARVLGKEAAS
jgi:uncharacterized phage-associated protein